MQPSFLCAIGFTGGAVCDRIMQMIRIKDWFKEDAKMELKKIQYKLMVCKVEDIWKKANKYIKKSFGKGDIIRNWQIEFQPLRIK